MPKRTGRPPKFESGGRYTFTAQWPREFARALARYAFEEEKPRTEIVFALLEELLLREGYLRVRIEKDPGSGAVIRVYDALPAKR